MQFDYFTLISDFKKCVFRILCNKNLACGRGKPHSALLWRSSNVHYFLAGSEQCQVLYVCDLCFHISLSFFLYCLSVLTALVKGYYNLQGEPATHLGRIKRLFCFMFQRVNSSVKWQFGLHVHTYIST